MMQVKRLCRRALMGHLGYCLDVWKEMTVEYIAERKQANKAATMMQRIHRGKLGRAQYQKTKRKAKKAELQAKYVYEREAERKRDAWKKEVLEEEARERLNREMDAKKKIEEAEWRAHLAKIEAEEARWKSEKAAIGREWEAIKDEYTGEEYYVNLRTGQSTWDKPLALMEKPEWEEMYDKLTGAVYYLHTETGETAWEKPEGFVSGLQWKKDDESSSSDEDKEPVHEPGTLCGACGKVAAVRVCKDCGHKPFCVACFASSHKSWKKKQHTVTMLEAAPPPSLKCVECEEEANRWCNDCEAYFCEDCYDFKHMRSPKDQHNFTAFVEGAAVCVLCESHLATLRCLQCEDNYCDSCFADSHKGAKRKKHEVEKLKPIADELQEDEKHCIDCQVRRATRLCDLCGDPYCDACYKRSHAKGKKAEHTWTPWEDLEKREDWVEVWDENAQAPFWYNVITRASEWEKPLLLMEGQERFDFLKKKEQESKAYQAVKLKDQEMLKLREQVDAMEKLTIAQAKENEDLKNPKKKKMKKKKDELNPGRFRKMFMSEAEKKQLEKKKEAREKKYLEASLLSERQKERMEAEKDTFGTDAYKAQMLQKLRSSQKDHLEYTEYASDAKK